LKDLAPIHNDLMLPMMQQSSDWNLGENLVMDDLTQNHLIVVAHFAKYVLMELNSIRTHSRLQMIDRNLGDDPEQVAKDVSMGLNSWTRRGTALDAKVKKILVVTHQNHPN
jgi:hypothetical protein